MERIILETNDEMGKIWAANFESLLQEIRDEATKNGLPEEILEKLLNDDDLL